MREKYESLSATVLKDLAKARGIKGLTGMKKEDLVEAMLAQDEKEKAASEEKKQNLFSILSSFLYPRFTFMLLSWPLAL